MTTVQSIVGAVIGIAWTIFIVVWIISAFSAKRTARRAGGRWLAYRLGIVVAIIVIVRYGGFNRAILYPLSLDPTVDIIGAALVILGLALGITARYHLGRNWGMPMSEKEGAELVTTGPYAYIRNPIYSGMLLAMLGSALSVSALWAIILVVSGGYYVWSVFGEEKIMARLFPDQYPAYKARTKRLIPWVW